MKLNIYAWQDDNNELEVIGEGCTPCSIGHEWKYSFIQDYCYDCLAGYYYLPCRFCLRMYDSGGSSSMGIAQNWYYKPCMKNRPYCERCLHNNDDANKYQYNMDEIKKELKIRKIKLARKKLKKKLQRLNKY